MIEWLNQNQGFVTALLTVVLILLTLVYVVTTIVIAKLNKSSIDVSKQNLNTFVNVEKNRLRPYVIFNILSESTVYSYVKNYGLTAAYKIKININPKLKTNYSLDDSDPITTKEISYIPPNFEIKNEINTSHSFYQEFKEPIFEVEIKYENASGERFAEKFSLDLTVLKEKIFDRSVSTDSEAICKELKNISSALKRY